MSKEEVVKFELRLEENLFALQKSLVNKTYKHDSYEDFYICDPKRRHIHKASVRDRVLHQAIFQVLYPIYDKHFIYDSYSSRNDKGTHLGMKRLQIACSKQTKNWKVKSYALKCDIRKFFDSIDKNILRELVLKKVNAPDFVWLLDIILNSFEKEINKGLPLGNVTSQLFANIYLNEFDQFAKHELKAKYYFRYCDDFVILNESKELLNLLLMEIKDFLKQKLKLELHPNKIEIRKVSQGIDFLGYIVLPHTIILRTKTGNRIRRKLNEDNARSYFGVLKHCRGRKLSNIIKTLIKTKS